MRIRQKRENLHKQFEDMNVYSLHLINQKRITMEGLSEKLSQMLILAENQCRALEGKNIQVYSTAVKHAKGKYKSNFNLRNLNKHLIDK